MGWSGRAPAPPAKEAGLGHRKGARHVSEIQLRNRRGWHRYRQELIPRRGTRSAWCDRAPTEMVARPGGNAAHFMLLMWLGIVQLMRKVSGLWGDRVDVSNE